ncbi:hypothetical protein [Rhizobium sp. BR 315]|uniref:hypothetical protein n=1 Tax=Rhizobium sp. BR 315 TaxID=3040014 RepID=UPI003D326D4C
MNNKDKNNIQGMIPIKFLSLGRLRTYCCDVAAYGHWFAIEAAPGLNVRKKRHRIVIIIFDFNACIRSLFESPRRVVAGLCVGLGFLAETGQAFPRNTQYLPVLGAAGLIVE